jgi:hypothetical protein
VPLLIWIEGPFLQANAKIYCCFFTLTFDSQLLAFILFAHSTSVKGCIYFLAENFGCIVILLPALSCFFLCFAFANELTHEIGRLYSNAYYDDVYRQTSLRSSRSVTYKEASDDETGSEDLVEVDEEEVAAAAAMEPDNSETIERVLAVRRGKCGGMQFESYYRVFGTKLQFL